MVVCSHCGRESRSEDRFCQYCGQQLDPSNGHLVAAFAPHYTSASGEPAEWQGPLVEVSAVPSTDQHSGQGLSRASSQQSIQARLVVRAMPETAGNEHSNATDAAGREYQLSGGDIAIGRAPSCDVVLEGDQLASRRHALMRRKGEVYTIVDLGSSNGTYVNDLEIREATTLKDGDIITIGGHEIVFSTAPASPHASIPGAAFAGAAGVPLGETDPSASAVDSPIFSTSAQSAAVDQPLPEDQARASDAAVAEPSDAPAEDAAAQAEDIVATPAEVGAESDAAEVESAAVSDAGALPSGADSNAENAPAEGSVPGDASAAKVGAVATFATPVVLASSDLDGLRVQLAEIGAALARKANEEARTADRLRAALADARDRLAMLSEQREHQHEQPIAEDVAPPAANVSELVSVARQAAENPRHLDYLTSFAAHAGEIAAALEVLETRQASAQSSGGNGEMLDTLNELRARLDDVLKQQ